MILVITQEVLTMVESPVTPVLGLVVTVFPPLVLATTISSSAAAKLKIPSAFEDLSLLVIAEL